MCSIVSSLLGSYARPPTRLLPTQIPRKKAAFRGNRLPVLSKVTTEKLLTKDDLVDYLRKGCKPRDKFRFVLLLAKGLLDYSTLESEPSMRNLDSICQLERDWITSDREDPAQARKTLRVEASHGKQQHHWYDLAYVLRNWHQVWRWTGRVFRWSLPGSLN